MVNLIAKAQISVLTGYTIIGSKPDGSPKLQAHSEDVAAGATFRVSRTQAESLIRDGHARLAPVEGSELI